MSRRRGKDGAIVVAVILLIVFVVGLLFAATNGFKSDVKSFALKRNEKNLILNDTYGLKFAETETFEVVNMSSQAKDFSVKIYAYGGADETDFTYTYDNEAGYSWKHFAEEEKRDFTACFDVTTVENRIVVKQIGIRLLCKLYDTRIKLPDVIPAGDRFVLEVTVGTEKITLGFSMLVRVTGVSLPEKIEFGI